MKGKESETNVLNIKMQALRKLYKKNIFYKYKFTWGWASIIWELKMHLLIRYIYCKR